jgi:hypothetical protein
VAALAVGALASLAVPPLYPLHIAAAVITGVSSGTGAATGVGTILTMFHANERRDPRTEQRETFERETDEPHTRVLHSTPGPWRSCRATDTRHLECVQHV